jgi:hypothetical protein
MRVAPTSRRFKGISDQYHGKPNSSSSGQPDNNQSDDRRTNPDQPDRDIRRLQYACHGSFGGVRKRGEDQAFDDKHQSERGQKVGHATRAFAIGWAPGQTVAVSLPATCRKDR